MDNSPVDIRLVDELLIKVEMLEGNTSVTQQFKVSHIYDSSRLQVGLTNNKVLRVTF